MAAEPASIPDLEARLLDQSYVADRGLAVSLFLALRLRRPLFLEGEAGVGKTALAAAAAGVLDTDLIRLQCYEGLEVSHALYEWDYARQLLELRILGASEHFDADRARETLYSERFIIRRPLLQAIDPARTKPAVLLIDEIDRADDGFEAFLLEVLSDFQVTIPELGTIRAAHPPYVVLTSNRTRELGDALRRRCLYLYLDHPTLEREVRIIRARCPEAADPLPQQIARFLQALRARTLVKPPGVAETLDFTRALLTLKQRALDADVVTQTLGCLLKDRSDLQAMTPAEVAALVEAVRQ